MVALRQILRTILVGAARPRTPINTLTNPVDLTGPLCGSRRTFRSSSNRLGRGSRVRPAVSDDFGDPQSTSYPSNPDFQPFALPVDEDLSDIGSTPAHPRPSMGHVQPELIRESPVHVNLEEPGRPPSVRATEKARRIRPDVDPKLTSIVLFPGQEAQFVGMGRKLLGYPNVPEIFGLAREIMGFDLLKLCLEGPEKELARTVNCQAAIFVTEMAALEKLREDYPMAVESCAATSGFSVGEIAALVFAGSLSFEDGLKLVKTRGEAMQAASEVVHGGMMTVQIAHNSFLTQAMDVARKWCKEKKDIQNPFCNVANYLHPDLKVIAGNVEALDFLEANQQQFNIQIVKRLSVSGAFHSPLMRPAADVFHSAIRAAELQSPKINVFSNVTSLPYRDVKEIAKLLIKQIHNPVRWEQIMHNIYDSNPGDNFPQTYEVGPGRQLGALLRKVNSKAFRSYTAIEV